MLICHLGEGGGEEDDGYFQPVGRFTAPVLSFRENVACPAFSFTCTLDAHVVRAVVNTRLTKFSSRRIGSWLGNGILTGTKPKAQTRSLCGSTKPTRRCPTLRNAQSTTASAGPPVKAKVGHPAALD